MKFKDKQLIIFDLDGTLIDSSPDLANAVNHTLRTLGRATFSTHTIHYWVGNGARMLIQRALSGDRKIDPRIDPQLLAEALEIFLDYYAQHLSIETRPYPNVISTLQQLQTMGYRLAIITNKPYAFVEPILRDLQLESYFEHYLGGDTLPEKKPHPMPLEHLCQTLDVTVAQSIMVGDSRNDILAAKACGMESIGVTYGYNYGEEIAAYAPELVIESFEAMLPTLRKEHP